MYGVSLIRSTSRGSKSKSWSMVWVDPRTKKKRKKSTGTGDKTLAKEIAHQLHLKLVRKAHGLLDEFEDHLDRPIGQHLNDYEKALTAKKRNDGYAEQTIGRIKRLIEKCGWETLGDIELTRLELVLGRLTDKRQRNCWPPAATRISRQSRHSAAGSSRPSGWRRIRCSAWINST